MIEVMAAARSSQARSDFSDMNLSQSIGRAELEGRREMPAMRQPLPVQQQRALADRSDPVGGGVLELHRMEH